MSAKTKTPWKFLLISCILAYSCNNTDNGYPLPEETSPATETENPVVDNDTLSLEFGITDLQPGDIIVRANHNWLPGSSFVRGGSGSGHVAIVLKGASDTIHDSLLAHSLILESHSRDLPVQFQIRTVPGYYSPHDPRYSNHSFGSEYKGSCFRLRFPMTPSARDSILAYVLRQVGKESSWRSVKKYPRGQVVKNQNGLDIYPKEWIELPSYYCSLLIWEAYISVLGIDIDANQGLVVYPNDMITSPWFNNTLSDETRRVRF